MDLVEALRTTGAVREFLPDPVPDDVVARVLDTARFAPSGGNRQAWHVVVVKDPSVRRRMRDLYLPGWYEYLAMSGAGLTPWAPITDPAAEAAALAGLASVPPGDGFAEHFDEVPVMLALLADLRRVAAVDRGFDRYTLVAGASVYPFAWSVLLAARGEGLGGVMTTMNVRREPEVKALLHAPELALLADLRRRPGCSGRSPGPRRGPLADFATVDRVDGAGFS